VTAEATKPQQVETPKRVAGLASIAIHGLVTVPRTAKVLGTSEYAVWLLVESSVVVVSTSDATRLPNSVEIAASADENLFESVRHGAPVELGWGRVMLKDLAVSVARWWDPRPPLPEIAVEDLDAAIAGLPSTVPTVESAPLQAALSLCSPTSLLAAAKPLIGKGEGLTPEADDYLAGALASTRLLSEALNHRPSAAMLDRTARHIAKLADTRTTTFSAALLQHALRGQVAAPAGALLRAFAGRGDVATAHDDLIEVGHSSGPALAAGVVLGAQSIIQYHSETDRRQS
jgi:hypothetical protein